MSSPARRALAASLLLALLAPATPAAAAAPVAPLDPGAPDHGAELVVASDGQRWYERHDGSLLRVAGTGAVPVPPIAEARRTAAHRLERGADGSVWTTVDSTSSAGVSGLARLSADGSSEALWPAGLSISGFAVDPAGDVVVTSGDSLFRVHPDASVTEVALPAGVGQRRLLSADPGGGVWLATGGGLWRLDGTTLRHERELPAGYPLYMAGTSQGPVWLVTSPPGQYALDLLRFDPADGQLVRAPGAGVANVEPASDAAGTLWAAVHDRTDLMRPVDRLVGFGLDGSVRQLELPWVFGRLVAGPDTTVWFSGGRVDTAKPFTTLTAALSADRRAVDLLGRRADGQPAPGPATVSWTSDDGTTTTSQAALGSDGRARVPLPAVGPEPTSLVVVARSPETSLDSGATSRAAEVHVPVLRAETDGAEPRRRLVVHLTSTAPWDVLGTVDVLVDGVSTGQSAPLRAQSSVAVPLPLTGGQHRVVARFTPTTPGWAVADSPPLDVVSQHHLDRYITRVYDELLGRLPDPGGLAYWRGLLATGTPRAAVASALSTAPEYRAAMVADTYGWVLGRAPDPAGHAYWTSRLLDGWTVQRLEAELYGSAEYYAVAGGTHEAFVTALYADVLGRAVDHGGFGYHVQRLRRGTPPRDLAASLVTSEEALRLVVDGHYGWFLGRTADEGGLRYWVGQILAGHREEGIVALLIGSDEYFAAS